jgi:hypothetical protein
MATAENDGLEAFEESSLEEETGEEETGEEEPEEVPAPAPVHLAKTKTPGAATDKKRKPRNDKGGTHAAPGEGWTNREADLMWPEMLQRIGRLNPPRTPYDLSIQVIRLSPSAVTLPNQIDGAYVVGDKRRSPGDALREAVIDYYHLPANCGPEEYELRFVWKQTGRVYGRGKLTLPSCEEIIGYRQAAERMRRRPRQAHGGMANSALDDAPYDEFEPPQAPRRAPVGYGATPPQAPVFAPAPTAAAADASGEVGYLRQQVGYLSGQLQQLMGLMGKPGFGAAPAPLPTHGAPAASVQPPQAPPATLEDAIERAAERILARAGIKPGMPGVGVAGTPPPTPASATNELHAGINAFRTFVGLGKELRHLAKELNNDFGEGAGGADEEPQQLIAEPVVTPPSPEDKLPFEVVPIPETDFLGHPAKYAIDKETGGFSREGFFMANPGLAEKAIEVGGKLVEALSRIGKGGAPQQAAAEVVREIPRGAVDAGVAGNGGGSNGGGEVPDGNGGL